MPVVDLSFRLLGKSIPADHGYVLYGALSGIVRAIHNSDAETWKGLGIHPINGQPSGDRRLTLTPSSRLTMRVDSDLIKDLLEVAGKGLTLGDDKVRVSVPTVYPLRPVVRLRSRLVTFKHRMEPEPFLAKAQEELSKLNIKVTPGLIRRSGARSLEGRTEPAADRSPFIRRTLRIHDKEVVGFAMEVSGLSADESLRLQETGLGGRRRFGCGIFMPVRE